MRLAALQYRPPHGQTIQAREQLCALLLRAKGADLVVCPEMAVSGYIFDSREEIAPHTEVADGETYSMLAECAQELGAWIVCGIAERDGDDFYNSALTIAPDGTLVSCYRKILLFEQDETWAQSGTERSLVSTDELGLLCPAICMDLNDNNFARFLVTEQPDVLAFCTNWLDEGHNILPYWRMRLFGWQGWMVAADRWGVERGVQFYGRSAILGPGDETLGVLPAEGDAVLIVDTESGHAEIR
jgi:predicted amidohydrolase